MKCFFVIPTFNKENLIGSVIKREKSHTDVNSKIGQTYDENNNPVYDPQL